MIILIVILVLAVFAILRTGQLYLAARRAYPDSVPVSILVTGGVILLVLAAVGGALLAQL